MDTRLVNSSSMIVAGPTQAGKTTFVHGLLDFKHWIFRNQPITQVYWICSEVPRYGARADVQYIVGIPPEGFDFIKRDSIVIIDDLMEEAKDSLAITNLFTKVAHHKNVFIIFITQNFFNHSKNEITRRRNCQYVVFFKNPADASQVRIIGSKMFPDNPNFLPRVYRDAVSKAHGYLLLDLRQETPDILRVRTNVLPLQFPITVYKQTK
jgi:hypothetical protein